ncbi:hypothetical protein HDU96_000295 [Phlyctochytrium bullatum]|nr:hypothetical protein HDU96_000295 [Phlyctochytrium bullatum]
MAKTNPKRSGKKSGFKMDTVVAVVVAIRQTLNGPVQGDQIVPNNVLPSAYDLRRQLPNTGTVTVTVSKGHGVMG